jgi:LytS/YehU family sensor histidine kinase
MTPARPAAQPLRIERIARVLYPAVLALIVYATLWVSSFFTEPPGLSPGTILGFIAFVAVLSEAIRLYSRGLDRRWPWHARSGARLSAQIGGSIVIAVVYAMLVYIPLKLYEIRHGAHDVIGWPHLAITSLVALVFALALSALHITLDFYASWQKAQRDAKQMETLIVRAELDALKAHVNPHFLFNSLNTVHGLIAQDPAAARALVVELSDVLRYALSHGNRDLVPLAHELAFLDAYRALLQARHGSGLRIEIDPMPDAERLRIPPMSLQLLVENAVRHNRTREDDPLVVHLQRHDDSVIVSNAIKTRHSANPGAGTGLSNIDQRYRLLGAHGIRIVREDGRFSVELGLFP